MFVQREWLERLVEQVRCTRSHEVLKTQDKTGFFWAGDVAVVYINLLKVYLCNIWSSGQKSSAKTHVLTATGHTKRKRFLFHHEFNGIRVRVSFCPFHEKHLAKLWPRFGPDSMETDFHSNFVRKKTFVAAHTGRLHARGRTCQTKLTFAYVL